MKKSLQEQKSSDPFEQRLKWFLWIIAWLAVVIEMGVDKILNAPFFPIGLVAIFLDQEKTVVIAWMLGLPAAIAGWLFYTLLSFSMMRTKKITVFFLLYIVFCVVLALNVDGCKKTLHSVQGIH